MTFKRMTGKAIAPALKKKSTLVNALLDHKAKEDAKERQKNGGRMPHLWYPNTSKSLKVNPGYSNMNFKINYLENQVRSVPTLLSASYMMYLNNLCFFFCPSWNPFPLPSFFPWGYGPLYIFLLGYDLHAGGKMLTHRFLQ